MPIVILQNMFWSQLDASKGDRLLPISSLSTAILAWRFKDFHGRDTACPVPAGQELPSHVQLTFTDVALKQIVLPVNAEKCVT